MAEIGRVLDIDKILARVKLPDKTPGKIKSRVALIGVELEGGWLEAPAGAQIIRDGSVVFANRNEVIRHIGELPIGPFPPEAVPAELQKYYPPKVNSTCGMHVHMSFNTLQHYQWLMVPEYQETIVHYLLKWATEKKFRPNHCIWARLKGESEFCLKEFWPDLQAGTKEKSHQRRVPGHRYTIIHYCGRQSTIECRVLPMMKDAKLAATAIQEVVDITNACIYELGRKAPRDANGLISTVMNNLSYSEKVIEVL